MLSHFVKPEIIVMSCTEMSVDIMVMALFMVVRDLTNIMSC